MANLKTADEVSLAGGKIGGQNFSNTKNGLIMRNTGYSNRLPTPKQSKQRFTFYALSNLWSQLTLMEKGTWSAASVDYTYFNSIGEEITRNGFQTFSFVNQNLALIGQLSLRSAPVYVSVLVPNVTIEASANSQLVIKGTNLSSSLTYVLFALPHFSNGQASIESTRLFISKLTDVQLSNGIDIIPLVQAVRATPNFLYQCTYQIVAINTTTGNKDLTLVTGTGQVNPTGLGLDILSYYEFNGNANDYFGVNNATYVGSGFNNGGIINGQAVFTGSDSSYNLLGDANSFNFYNGSIVTGFSVCGWVKFNTTNWGWLFGKRAIISGGDSGSYQFLMRDLNYRATIFDGGLSPRVQYRSVQNVLIDTFYFFAFSYNENGTSLCLFNNNVMPLFDTVGTYSKMQQYLTPLSVGRDVRSTSFNLNGSISELTFFNETLSIDTLNTIRLANLAGQTIIDIN